MCKLFRTLPVVGGILDQSNQFYRAVEIIEDVIASKGSHLDEDDL